MWNALTPSGTRNDFKIFNFKKGNRDRKQEKLANKLGIK